MRNTHLSVIAAGLLGAASTAQAGEWSGVYIGIGGGMGAANHELSFEEAPGVPINGSLVFDGIGGSGGIFTLGVGADYQVNSRLVLGAFFDYDWTNIESDIVDLQLGPDSVGADVDVENVWSIGGRAGYLVSPSTMLFLTAGYSRADISDIATTGAISGFTVASVGKFDGYFIGGGAEVKLSNALSLKGEYRYTDLDAETITLLPGTPLAGINDFVTTKLDPDFQTARVSLNYRFGLGGPSIDAPDAPDAPDVPVSAVGSWSQYYVGVGGAYAFANNELSFSPGPALPPIPVALTFDGLGSQGGAFTVGLGVDRQYDDKFVFGVFVDYTGHSNEYEISLDVAPFVSGSLGYEIEDELSVGARAGYLLTPSSMVFGSVGYSRLWLSDTVVSGSVGGIGPIPALSGSLVLADNGSVGGVFLGGGFETKLSDNLSLKAEYRYLFADTETITLLPNDFPLANEFVSAEISPDIQSVRLSLDYRFNFGERDAAPLK